MNTQGFLPPILLARSTQECHEDPCSMVTALFCASSYHHCPLPPCPPFFSTLLAAPGCPRSFVSPTSEACRESSLQTFTVSFHLMGPRKRTPVVQLRGKCPYPGSAISLAPVGNHLPCFGEQSECRLQMKMANKGCRHSLTPEVPGFHLSEQGAKRQDVPCFCAAQTQRLRAACAVPGAKALPIGLPWLTPPTSAEKERGRVGVLLFPCRCSTSLALSPLFMARGLLGFYGFYGSLFFSLSGVAALYLP